MVVSLADGKPFLLRPLMVVAIIFGVLMGSILAKGQISAESVQRFDLRIENNRLVGNLQTIRVRRDDAVAINWMADRLTVLHLHGYGIEKRVNAKTPMTMTFQAHATGRFPIEMHDERGNHKVVIYLEVHPR